MKTMMKKAQNGGKTYPLKGIETPTPGSINGKRGLPLDKKIQEGIKSGKLNKDGTTKNPFPKKKMGGTMKKAKDGSAFAKLAPPYDKATFADKIAGATKGKAKSGTKMKKAMMGVDMMQSPMMKKGGSMKKCKYGCK
jgi:hypothetical protein